jgi:hypothetical protein
MWRKPVYYVSLFMGGHSVIWKPQAKQFEIMRTLSTIETQRLQLRKILIDSEKAIKYLILYRQHLRRDGQGEKNRFYIINLVEDRKMYQKHYQVLRNYYELLDKHEKRYRQLLEAIKERDRCFRCFNQFCSLRQVKSQMVCEDCLTIEHQQAVKVECQICYRQVQTGKMKELDCGNHHQVCQQCYTILVEYQTQRCPFCRGEF